jgi:hypothetical protein
MSLRLCEGRASTPSYGRRKSMRQGIIMKTTQLTLRECVISFLAFALLFLWLADRMRLKSTLDSVQMKLDVSTGDYLKRRSKLQEAGQRQTKEDLAIILYGCTDPDRIARETSIKALRDFECEHKKEFSVLADYFLALE